MHTNTYLKATSHHHEAQKRALIKTLFFRAEKICDNDSLEEETMKLRQALNQNGYTNQIISRALKHQKSTNSTLGKDKAFSLRKGSYRKNWRYPIFKSQNRMASLLTPVKDKQDKLLVKSIYHIPCECGKAYIEETGWSVRTRVKEHKRYICLKQINMSAIADHAIETNHKISLEDTKVLVRENSFWARKIREAIEIRKNPENFNRDAGYDLHPLWFSCLGNKQEKTRQN